MNLMASISSIQLKPPATTTPPKSLYIKPSIWDRGVKHYTNFCVTKTKLGSTVHSTVSSILKDSNLSPGNIGERQQTGSQQPLPPDMGFLVEVGVHVALTPKTNMHCSQRLWCEIISTGVTEFKWQWITLSSLPPEWNFNEIIIRVSALII